LGVLQPGKYLQAEEMDVLCITWLFVLIRTLEKTNNLTGAKNIREIFFRIYRVVNKTGFIKMNK
jgi:hypothetical protein